MKKLFLNIFFGFLCLLLWANQDVSLQDAFEKAQQMIKKSDFISVYEQLADRFPEHLYGQKAIFELGKIALLERNYQEAIAHFKSIYHSDITEKEYWLGKAYFQAGEYHHAILSAQNYIFDSQNNGYIEESYFIISESYIMQRLYQRALNTLDFLRQSQYIKNHIPLLYYQMIICHIHRNEYDDAHAVFRKMKSDFPYAHHTFMAEEQIYQLTVAGNYSTVSLPPPTTGETGSQENPQTYLQVGAFSTLANAQNQKNRINQLGLEGITFPRESSGRTLYVAAAGPFHNDHALERGKAILERSNISYLVIQH